MEFTGEQDFIPFRYQGQYEDMEVGLYYNRYRYYDPEKGNYTQVDPIGLAGGNPTLYAYVSNPNAEVDLFGLAPWKNGGFIEWFNKATPEQVFQHIQSVKRALRNGGGFHEMFPVSMAVKARELGFSAEELLEMVVPFNGDKKVFFEGILDGDGNTISGKHHSSSASKRFHDMLIKQLKSDKTKEEALGIINKNHDHHMKMRCK